MLMALGANLRQVQCGFLTDLPKDAKHPDLLLEIRELP